VSPQLGLAFGRESPLQKDEKKKNLRSSKRERFLRGGPANRVMTRTKRSEKKAVATPRLGGRGSEGDLAEPPEILRRPKSGKAANRQGQRISNTNT